MTETELYHELNNALSFKNYKLKCDRSELELDEQIYRFMGEAEISGVAMKLAKYIRKYFKIERLK